MPSRAFVLDKSAQQLVRDHLVTVGILAQRRKFAVSKDAIQIQGLPGLVCPVKLIAKLLQRHPLHRALHGTTVPSDHTQPGPSCDLLDGGHGPLLWTWLFEQLMRSVQRGLHRRKRVLSPVHLAWPISYIVTWWSQVVTHTVGGGVAVPVSGYLSERGFPCCHE